MTVLIEGTLVPLWVLGDYRHCQITTGTFRAPGRMAEPWNFKSGLLELFLLPRFIYASPRPVWLPWCKEVIEAIYS